MKKKKIILLIAITLFSICLSFFIKNKIKALDVQEVKGSSGRCPVCFPANVKFTKNYNNTYSISNLFFDKSIS